MSNDGDNKNSTKIGFFKLQKGGGIVTTSIPLGILNDITSYVTIKSCGFTFTSGNDLIT